MQLGKILNVTFFSLFLVERRTTEKVKVRVLKSHVTQTTSSKINLHQENVLFLLIFRNKLLITLQKEK